MSIFILPLLLVTAPAEVRVDPCHAFQNGSIVFQGPGPSESDVPLNTSIWLSVIDASAQDIEVIVNDPVALRTVPSRVERLFVRPNDGQSFDTAVRVILEEELIARRSYQVEVRLPQEGVQNGLTFTTGDARDDVPPAAPVVEKVEGAFVRQDCYASYGLSVKVRSSTESANLIHLFSEGGVAHGLARGETVRAIHGHADAHVTGALVAIDLAGNTSRSSALVQGQTPSANTADSDEAGCSTAGASPSALAIIAALALLFRRRAR